MTKVGPKRRERIFALREEGRSPQGIANLMKLNRSTVYSILKRPRTRAIRPPKRRYGPHPMLSEAQEQKIVDLLLRDNKTGLQNLVHVVKRELKLNVSRSTLQRISQKHHLVWGKQKVIPAITPTNIRKRLAWAKKNIRTDFSKVIFSDEKIFHVGDPVHHRYRRGERENVEANRWSGQVHVWWAINPDFKIKPVIISENLNSARYVQVLGQRTAMLKKRGYIFQQDNAPSHRAKRTKEWLAEKHITVLKDWPAQSADLNPIENAWATINTAVQKRRVNSVTEFEAVVQDEIQKFSQATVRSLCNSMPSRLEAVIAAGGRATKY